MNYFEFDFKDCNWYYSMASPLVRRASREDDYDENDRDPEAYPYRVLRKGNQNGLALSIYFDRDQLVS